jgi:hypothetical protein
MSGAELSINRFLSDHRQVNFIITAGGQDYELAMPYLFKDGLMHFYVIFKPAEYDHIILMSDFTPSWPIAKTLFKEITDQVVEAYGIDLEDYPDLLSFIS